MGDGADFADRAIDQVQGLGDLRQRRRKTTLPTLQLAHVDLHCGEILPNAVVKFARDLAALGILQFEDTGAQHAVGFRVPLFDDFLSPAPLNFIEKQAKVVNQ